MGIFGAARQLKRHALISFYAINASIGGGRTISLVVVAVLGRVHNDGRPAMGLVPIGMPRPDTPCRSQHGNGKRALPFGTEETDRHCTQHLHRL
jgi:hypothetical protein